MPADKLIIDLASLKENFANLDNAECWVCFYNGKKWKVPTTYEVINDKLVMFHLDITGIDVLQINGVLWKERD